MRSGRRGAADEAAQQTTRRTQWSLYAGSTPGSMPCVAYGSAAGSTKSTRYDVSGSDVENASLRRIVALEAQVAQLLQAQAALVKRVVHLERSKDSSSCISGESAPPLMVTTSAVVGL